MKRLPGTLVASVVGHLPILLLLTVNSLSNKYHEPVEGNFPDATQQILEAMKSPSDDELDCSSDSSESEPEPE